MKNISPKVILLLLLALILPAIFASSCKDNAVNPVIPSDFGFEKIGSFDSPGTANDVYVTQIDNSDVAFLADGNSGFHILNVNNPASPTIISSYNTQGYTYDVKPAKINSTNYAFLADGGNDFVVMDIADLNNPIQKFVVEFIDDAIISITIDTVSNKAFAGSFGGFLYIIELNGLPNNLSVIGTYDAYDKVEGIFVKSGICYLAERDFGLEIVNVSDYTFPVSLSSANTPGEAFDVIVLNNIAYVADGTAGVSIFEVSNNFNPNYVGTVNCVDVVSDISISQSKVFTSEITYGVECLSILSPLAPSVIGAYKTSSSPFGVFSLDNILFVANGSEGLTILSTTN